MDKKLKIVMIGGLVFLLIFLASLTGTIKGYITPTQIMEKVGYHHQGQFEVKAYSRPKASREILFLPIMEKLEMFFAYSSKPKTVLEGIPREIKVKAILEDERGRWKKEIPLFQKEEKTPYFQFSFPLEWEKFLELGRSIEEELAPSGSVQRSRSYLLNLEVIVKTSEEEFVSSLHGKINPAVLEWKDGFENFERSSKEGINYWQLASFGYQAKLKPNLLFDQTSLEREINLKKPKLINPNTPLFNKKVEAMDVGFSYQFDGGTSKEEVKIDLMMSSQQWKRTFPLFPLTQKEGKFTFIFPLDLDNLKERAREIDEEIGSNPSREQEITIKPWVKTSAIVGSENIQEVFQPQLKIKIGEKIEIGPLSSIKKGEIKKIKKINLLALPLRRYGLIGLVGSFLCLLVLFFFYWQRKPEPLFLEREARLRKKYRDLLSQVTDYPAVKEGETVIDLFSLKELAKVANNLARPIFFKVEQDRIVYWILENKRRYQYISKEKKN